MSNKSVIARSNGVFSIKEIVRMDDFYGGLFVPYEKV